MSTSTQISNLTEPYIGSALHKERERARQKRIYHDNKERERARHRDIYNDKKGIKWHCEICNIEIELNSKRTHIK